MLGRPFAVTCMVMMIIFLLAGSNQPDVKNFLLLAALLAVSTFVHGVWHLWLLPIAAFVFTGEFRWSVALTGAWILAATTSALLSG
jgi:hypothetical protein